MDETTRITNQLIKDYLDKRTFSVTYLEINEENKGLWIRVRIDPEAFRKKMFDGAWFIPGNHPDLGTIKVLGVLNGNDGITRAVARQGEYLYAYPLI